MDPLKTLVALALLSVSVVGETPLRGDVGGLTLSENGNPYVVQEDITVPQGKRCTIGPGCVVLFKEFTGCRVDGELIAQGTIEKPVVFTSAHDTTYNPASRQLANPFDWNGLTISALPARAEFANIILEFSVFGIKAQSKNVSVKNGVFSRNGQYHFTVEDKIQYVQDNVPFSYAGTADATAHPSKPPRAARSEPAGAGVKDRKIVRIALVSSGIVLAGLGAVLTSRYVHEKGILDDMAAHPSDYAAQLKQDPNLWNTQTDKKRTVGTFAVITDVAAGLCLIGFGLTFAF